MEVHGNILKEARNKLLMVILNNISKEIPSNLLMEHVLNKSKGH
uniref:Uncharacterized protein n=1 Tax=Myoviridae sp. ctCo31 TaxID=2825053 RepID=A0A8S5UMN6_9CAUD|nr:MAG TPA: hypothetical protein [Myoviridae sp. ctCo31]